MNKFRTEFFRADFMIYLPKAIYQSTLRCKMELAFAGYTGTSYFNF